MKEYGDYEQPPKPAVRIVKSFIPVVLEQLLHNRIPYQTSTREENKTKSYKIGNPQNVCNFRTNRRIDHSIYFPCSLNQRSTSSAAMQPKPAAVIACL